MNDLTLTASGEGVYTINLAGYTPPARYGPTAGAWTGVRVEESTTEAGAWTALATSSLSPQDQDPSQPAAWRFTVAGATLAHGWYRVVWLDQQGDEQPTEPVYNGPPVRPTVKDLAKLLPQRATLDGGARAFTFNNDTDPTGEEVDGLIDVALDQVLIQIPDLDALTKEQVEQARAATGYLAAVLVENAHFSEQVEAGDSLAGTLQVFHDKAIAALLVSLNQNEAGTARFASVTVVSPTLSAFYSTTGFPTELLP